MFHIAQVKDQLLLCFIHKGFGPMGNEEISFWRSGDNRDGSLLV